jgi:glycine dehydrogenase subunit 1
MGTYVGTSATEQSEMLKKCGVSNFSDLYEDISESVRLTELLDVPSGLSELEVHRNMQSISDKNTQYHSLFRGAGAYNHYIPSIVKQVTSKEEFVTAYTPYQAEISQGILQSIFEYQTMICLLTGLDVSNASVYDGATAAAESVFMCLNRKKTKVLVAETINPDVLSVIKTYSFGRSVNIETVPSKDGITDMEALTTMMSDETACFLFQQPNFYGIIEDSDAISKIVHENGAKLIVDCNPISLGVLPAPSEYDADIAVGEGQPLGLPLSFGGPFIGFMAAKKELVRKLPGRIVGETVDTEGRRGFVLTLQAREQHIRREKALSNICSNEALCALTVSVYLATVGPKGLKQVAQQSMSKAVYLQKQLALCGFDLVYEKEYFNEFVTTCPVNVKKLMNNLSAKGILGGLPIGNNQILWCCTEMNSKADMDELISVIHKEVK